MELILVQIFRSPVGKVDNQVLVTKYYVS